MAKLAEQAERYDEVRAHVQCGALGRLARRQLDTCTPSARVFRTRTRVRAGDPNWGTGPARCAHPRGCAQASMQLVASGMAACGAQRPGPVCGLRRGRACRLLHAGDRKLRATAAPGSDVMRAGHSARASAIGSMSWLPPRMISPMVQAAERVLTGVGVGTCPAAFLSRWWRP